MPWSEILAAPAGSRGPAILRLPDVLMMLQPSFWSTDLMTGTRSAAMTALLACSHIWPGMARKIRLEDWRPAGADGSRLDVVRILRFGRLEEVHLTPTAIYVVEAYIAERDRVAAEQGWHSPLLFVARTGQGLAKQETHRHFWRLARRIASRTSVGRMLRNFCVRNLRKGGDEAASRTFRGFKRQLGDQNKLLPEVDRETLVRFVERTDPFRDMGRQVRDEKAAFKWLAARADELVVPFPTPHRVPMPVDDPVVAEILREDWPRGKQACRVVRARIWKTHGRHLDRLLREGILTFPLLSKLMHQKAVSLQSYVRIHYRLAVPVPVQPTRAAVGRPRRTNADNAVISAVEAFPAPDRESLIARVDAHLPALEDMIFRRVIQPAEVRRLLGLAIREFQIVRDGRKKGLSAARLLVVPGTPPPLKAVLEQVDRAAATRGAETKDDFCYRMIAEGFPGFFLPLWRRVEKVDIRARPPAARITAEEDDRLAGLRAAARGSAGRLAAGDERTDGLLRDLVFVDDLVNDGKIASGEAHGLLAISQSRYLYFRGGLKLGLSVEELLAPTGSHWREDPAVLDAVEREHRLTPDEPDIPFFWRMRRFHGFRAGIDRMRSIRGLLRATAGTTPAGRAPDEAQPAAG